MKKDLFLHNGLFRFFVPIFYGIIAYFIILLIFDSFSQIKENFFSREAFFVILLSYCIFEASRYIVVVLDENCPVRKKIRYRISLQFLVNIISSALITSVFLLVYFRYVIGYTIFLPELFTINTIFIFTGILYNMLFFSIFFLHEKNEIQINKELVLKENIEYELETYKDEINPDLFFTGLETLISLIHFKKNEADKFIKKFSSIYRYLLDNKKKELITLRKELENLDNLLYIFKIRHDGNILFSQNIGPAMQMLKVIPCSMQMVIEAIIEENIISSLCPLEIKCSCTDSKYIQLESTYNPKIKQIKNKKRFVNLERSFAYFTDKRIEFNLEENKRIIKLPLLEITEEEVE